MGKVKYGSYVGVCGFLYRIKAIEKEKDKFDVYAKQISPSLQLGWSFWGEYSREELEKTFKIDEEI